MSKVTAAPRGTAKLVLASWQSLLLLKDNTKLSHHHCCWLRHGYRAAPRRFLSRLMDSPLVRKTCNFEGCWMVPRPTCPSTSTGLMMDMRKLLPQECGTALGQGTREVEIPMLGSFPRLSRTKPQLTSPTAGNSLAPSRMFAWRPPEGPATGTAGVL